MTVRQTSLQTLQQVHRFPGSYLFKVIGPNNVEFICKTLQIALWVLGPKSTPQISLRYSKSGRHQCVSMEVHVKKAEEILDIYQLLRRFSGANFIL